MHARLLLAVGVALIATTAALAQDSLPIATTPVVNAPAPLPLAGPGSGLWPADDAAQPAQHSGTMWTSKEYLYFWPKATPLSVPLATTGSPATAAAAGLPLGALGTPGTAILNPNYLDYGPMSGGRVTAGWIDCEGFLGLQASGFLMESRSASFQAQSGPSGAPLSVPILSPVTELQSALDLALPGVSQGGMLASSTVSLWGSEVNGMLGIYHDTWLNVYGLLGFRYIDLSERLDITSLSTAPFADPTAGLPAPGPAVLAAFNDQFATRNQMYLGQAGFQGEAKFGGFFCDFALTAAMGQNHETLLIDGNTTGAMPGPGGIFTQLTNDGRWKRSQFTVAPEAKLQLGYDITHHIRVYAGYDFLYLTKVARPGDQMDHQVDLTQSPFFVGSAAAAASVGVSTNPAQYFNTTNFWIQGVTAGLQINF